MATDTTTETGYEFTAAQNVEFKAAAYWMGIMGRLGVLFSLVAVLFTGPPVLSAFGNVLVAAEIVVLGLNLLGAVSGLVIAVWTIRAGTAFGRVASTAGRDIDNVMVAVGNLKSLYRLQAVLIGIVFALFLATLAVGLFGAM